MINYRVGENIHEIHERLKPRHEKKKSPTN